MCYNIYVFWIFFRFLLNKRWTVLRLVFFRTNLLRKRTAPKHDNLIGMVTQSCNQPHKHCMIAHTAFGGRVFARHEYEENNVKRHGNVPITCKKRTDKMQGGMSKLSNGFVVVMGLATVFIGLICIILLIMIVSALCRISSSVAPQSQAKDTAPASVTPVAPVAQAAAGQIERGVLVAVVSAAIAEELGTDVSAIRIVSLQKR